MLMYTHKQENIEGIPSAVALVFGLRDGDINALFIYKATELL